MDLTNIPTLVAVPFASGAGAGYRNVIPVASQIPVTPGAASFTDGFPPVTFQPIASGGVPPYGADFNGILYDLSFANRWNQAGGRYYFDAAFASAVTGYPKGATLNRTDNLGAWLNTVDGNTTDPNATSSAGWVPVRANAVAVSIAVTAGATTPTKEKLGSQVIVCTGSIASAATLVLPLTAGAVYVVHNNTTGAGSLTVIGVTGSGVTIPQTVGYYVYTDGTNFYGASADVSGLYLPINGTAVAATKLAAARLFNLAGVVTSAGASFDGSGNVTLTAAFAANPAFSGNLSATGAVNAGSGYTFGSDPSALVYLAAAGAVGVRSSGGFYSFDALGNFNALSGGINAVGTITSQGATAGFAFNDRVNANSWTWYSSSSVARLFAGGSGDRMTVDWSGNATFSGSVTAAGGFQNSDRRLKKNVKPRDVQRGFALKLARMFVEWDRIADGVHDVGLIAQRVKSIASRYVIRGKKQGRKAGMLAIDKSGIALEASMDCALQLDEQAKTISALRRRIEKLEKAR